MPTPVNAFSEVGTSKTLLVPLVPPILVVPNTPFGSELKPIAYDAIICRHCRSNCFVNRLTVSKFT